MKNFLLLIVPALLNQGKSSFFTLLLCSLNKSTLSVNVVLTSRGSRGDPVQGQRPLPRVRLRAARAHHAVHLQHRWQRAVLHLPAHERAVPPRGPRAVADDNKNVLVMQHCLFFFNGLTASNELHML